MTDTLFRKLQERLDLYSMGFPATASCIELKILRYLFSEDDAAMFLALSHSLETPEAVASRLGQPVDRPRKEGQNHVGRSNPHREKGKDQESNGRLL